MPCDLVDRMKNKFPGKARSVREPDKKSSEQAALLEVAAVTAFDIALLRVLIGYSDSM